MPMNYEKLIEQRKVVANRIEEELANDDFILSIASYVGIHERLFKNILPNYGHIRKYNIEKNEIILDFNSLSYPDYHTVPTLLKFAIQAEKKVNYQALDIYDAVKHIADFTAKIWYIHPFIDGNTRTTCVFIEKYLKSLGITINNDYFKIYAEYFRNALVKANYENQELGISKDSWPITKFFIKLLMDNTLVLDEGDLFIPELYDQNNKIKKRIPNK